MARSRRFCGVNTTDSSAAPAAPIRMTVGAGASAALGMATGAADDFVLVGQGRRTLLDVAGGDGECLPVRADAFDGEACP